MKYILKKDLPLAKAGTEVKLLDAFPSMRKIILVLETEENIGEIGVKDIPEWLEQVKEVKTIYDLEKGDTIWGLYENLTIYRGVVGSNFDISDGVTTRVFVTEREAKRNKLLRELATRNDKFLPNDNQAFIDWNGDICTHFGEFSTMMYNMGLIFQNKEDYKKWMTDEAQDLLFNL